jgi:hypothetical protein
MHGYLGLLLKRGQCKLQLKNVGWVEMGDSLDCAVSLVAVAAQWSCTLVIWTVAANMYIIYVLMKQSWQVMLTKDTSIVALNINGSEIGAERIKNAVVFPWQW